jgi:hypothetical protein
VSEVWYPPPSDFYVRGEEAQEYPLRQGDLVGPVLIDGATSPIVQIVHPTCELGKSAVNSVQVCTVRRLAELDSDTDRAAVVAGMRETHGRSVVAFANTFFLPGIPPEHEGVFADFREIHLVDRKEVRQDTRQAALTHDCRVHFIRRWFYFRFRILLTLDQVRGLETERIRADRTFQGPRPDWAS